MTTTTVSYEIDERCASAATQLMEGNRVKAPQSLVRQFGIPALLAGVSSWLHYYCSMETLDYQGQEGFESREYRVWAEVLPDGGVRFHGKRVG